MNVEYYNRNTVAHRERPIYRRNFVLIKILWMPVIIPLFVLYQSGRAVGIVIEAVFDASSTTATWFADRASPRVRRPQ